MRHTQNSAGLNDTALSPPQTHLAPPSQCKKLREVLHFPCSGLEKLVLPRTMQGHMKKSMQEGSLPAWCQVPTLADGGEQSTESPFSEWHQRTLSLMRRNTQQYHLLRGDKGQRKRQGLSKRCLNHLSYSLTSGNNQGKSK